MPTPFPGMDPYLEQPPLWLDVHNSLIAALRDDLAPNLRPRYYVSIEERSYVAGLGGLSFARRPDIAVVKVHEPAPGYHVAARTPEAGKVTVELPVPDIVRETYLEIRDREAEQIVTVLEILSPTNKLPGKGRARYERKRMQLLDSPTNLVEIDLLRNGLPMSMRGDFAPSHYRILISRALSRPQAELLYFSVRTPIPDFSLPLQPGEPEPLVALNRLLHELYDRAGYDLRIDYRTEPEPPLDADDAAWADALLRQAGLR